MRIKLDIPLSTEEICFATNGAIGNLRGRYIDHLTTDSREVAEGDLFIAITGINFNGEDYVNDALQKGAIALSCNSGLGRLKVSSTSSALLHLAKYYKTLLPNLKQTVGITGSVGKTSAKEFLTRISSEKYLTHSTDGNKNNCIGLPLSILKAPQKTEILILEMGMNSKGEIKKLSECARPDIGIITKVGSSHLGFLGDKKQIALAKSEITYGMNSNAPIIVNENESLLDGLPNRFTFSVDENENAHLVLKTLDCTIHGSYFTYKFKDYISPPLFIPIPGKHMLETLASTICVAHFLGLNDKEIINGLSKIDSSSVRSGFVRIEDFTVFDDSYNASLESIMADIVLFKHFCAKNRSALLGDILELGDQTRDIHRSIGKSIAQNGFSRLYLIGDYSKYYLEGALEGGMTENNIFVNNNYSDKVKTAKQILANHKSDDVILFKGSHKIGISEVLKILKSTGDKTK